MTPYAVPLDAVRATDLPQVGGKGAMLGELAAAGFPVPGGFCVTTPAYARFIERLDPERILALDRLDPNDLPTLNQQAEALRLELNSLPMPSDVATQILAAFDLAEADAGGDPHAYAVRSSATTEDLADASFAGQQDTYLNIYRAQLLENVKACWISLFTDRAVLYRRLHGYSSQTAQLSVVVQRMILPEISGIAFTADPVSGDRNVCSVDASWGLGEALVSGIVEPDLYRVQKVTKERLEVRIGAKQVMVVPKNRPGALSSAGLAPSHGTETIPVEPERRGVRVLSDVQLDQLVTTCMRIEALRGVPQDVEWGIANEKLYILQARPITSLYPLPEPARPGGEGVYLSFGHVQVNTAVMPPVTISAFRHIIPLLRGPDGQSPMVTGAGGRIFVDVSFVWGLLPVRRIMLAVMGNMDRQIADRLREVFARPQTQKAPPPFGPRTVLPVLLKMVSRVSRRMLLDDPTQVRASYEARLAQFQQDLLQFEQAKTLLARVQGLRQSLGRLLEPVLLQGALPTAGTGMLSLKLLGVLMQGKVDDATLQLLTRGFDGNLTTEMDLELGDVADIARPYPALVSILTADADPLERLKAARALPEATAFFAAWDRFLARHGYRCAGEIDIAMPRWSDDPSFLVRVVAGMLAGGEAGAHRRRHAEGAREAAQAASNIHEAARKGWLGWVRGPLAKALSLRARSFLALREHHKGVLIQVLAAARRLLLEVGRQLEAEGRLHSPEDIWMLKLEEIEAALLPEGNLGSDHDLRSLVATRTQDAARFATLKPPRVMLGTGEIPKAPRGKLQPGVLEGIAVSPGVMEGIAHVILDPSRETLQHGEILVAPFTDPGWTPLFMHASALVMEVGGVMTHGSVVAREYGIPAVVGVNDATSRIRTGQRIRVDGEAGTVTLLPDLPAEVV